MAEPEVDNVSAALDLLERRLDLVKEAVMDLRAALAARHTTIAKVQATGRQRPRSTTVH